MRSGKPGKTLAFRADMDGLLVEEETGVEYASLNKGLMHSCGHDDIWPFCLDLRMDRKNERHNKWRLGTGLSTG